MGLVKMNCRNLLALFCMALMLGLSGCGWAYHYWNESAPPKKTVTVVGDPLPSFIHVFDGDEATSKSTLAQWKTSTLTSFGQIKGNEKDFLSEFEIETLIRLQLIHLGPDLQDSVSKLHSLIRLLGFKDGVSKTNVTQLFDWVEANRAKLRTFYQVVMSHPTTLSFTSSQLIELTELASSLFKLNGDESYSAPEMSQLIGPWIPETLPHLKASVPSGVNLTLSFLASLCGDRIDSKKWNGKKIGVCFEQMVEHFKPLAPEFDFIAGALDPLQQRAELIQSNDQLVPLVTAWLKDHHHPPFSLVRISDLANDLHIQKPYNFFKLTEWLPKLNPKNTTALFAPEFVIDLANLINHWVGKLIQVTEKQVCTQKKWGDCLFTGNYDTLSQIYNEEYGTQVRIKNLNLVSRMAFFEAIVQEVFDALDPDHTGYLGVQIKDLITVAIRAVDSHSFLDNTLRRIQELPVYDSNVEEDLAKIEKFGLSEVAALAGSIIPQVSDYRTGWQKLASNFTNHDKSIPYTIEPLGLTSVLYVYDMISELRNDYLTRYHFPLRVTSPNDAFIKRITIVKAIPQILFDHFPRIYNACLDFGFEESCGAVFTQVLPNSDPGQDDIQPYQMDMMTLTAILAESIMTRCDRNQDDLIRSNILDGNDEKTCVLKIAQALVTRLMDAGIMDKNEKIKNLVNLVTGTKFLRYVGKQALGEGSFAHALEHVLTPLRFKSHPGTLGTILGLTADAMDSDKIKAIKNGTLHEEQNAGIGDDLVYLRRMSQTYLPKGRALRTTEIGQWNEAHRHPLEASSDDDETETVNDGSDGDQN